MNNSRPSNAPNKQLNTKICPNEMFRVQVLQEGQEEEGKKLNL